MRIDSVEIDPVVVDVAEPVLGLPEDERLSVTVADARRYIQASPDTYDIIIVDANYADSLPFHPHNERSSSARSRSACPPRGPSHTT